MARSHGGTCECEASSILHVVPSSRIHFPADFIELSPSPSIVALGLYQTIYTPLGESMTMAATKRLRPCPEPNQRMGIRKILTKSQRADPQKLLERCSKGV